jgi:hypothetical protein
MACEMHRRRHAASHMAPMPGGRKQVNVAPILVSRLQRAAFWADEALTGQPQAIEKLEWLSSKTLYQ